MLNRAVGEFDRARSRMAGDFRNMIADSEDLLKAVASVSGEGFGAARTKFEQNLTRAKAALEEATRPAIDRTMQTAAYADEYAHGNPWTLVGVAIAAGALIGFLSARR